MLIRWLQRFVPDAEQLRANKTLQKFGPALQHAELWQLNRRSARFAVAIGFFCACLPIPCQMLLAAALAIGCRGHLPLAVGLVWLNNPVTLPFIFYGNYRLGLLLTTTTDSAVASSSLLEQSGAELMAQLGELAIPLAIGSVLAGLGSAALASLLLDIVWRWRQRS